MNKMQNMKILFLLLMLPLMLNATEPDINSLVQAEKDFSKLSVEKGIKDSFVVNFADDAIIFRPTPVAGKKWYEGRPAVPGVLSWQPVLSEIAASGELGYNTGPYEYREKADAKAVGFGEFFSFWKKRSDGKWKVVLDQGVEHSMPSNEVKLETIVLQSKAADSKNDDLLMLKQVDQKFSQISKEQGVEKAFAKFLAQKTRIMRPQLLPESNRDKALAIVAQEKGTLTWEASGGDIAKSGDLGYTYGLSQRNVDGKIEKGNYVRAWRKENGEWKVAVDVMTPFPLEK
jgi:ketosteroid isomerase-like protein